MTYRTVQKVGNNHYLYEVDAVWDPVKKNSRQIRKYLGKCDPEGNLIQESRNSRSLETVKTFGPYYLLTELARTSGMTRRLCRTFGERDGKLMLAVACIRVVKPGPMRQILDHIDDSFLTELLDIEEEASLIDIAALLSSTGMSDSLMDKYFASCTKGREETVFELSPFRSVPIRDSFFYCAECRTGRVPRVNVSLSVNIKDRMPSCYTLHRSYVTGAREMEGTEQSMREMGSDSFHHVIGPGSFSELTIQDMAAAGITFTAIVPNDHPAGSSLLGEGSSVFFRSKNTRMYNGYEVKVHETSYDVSGHSVRAIVMEEQARKYEELEQLHKDLSRFESSVSHMQWEPRTVHDLEGTEFGDIVHLFTISENEDGTVRAVRNQEEIELEKNKCGKLVIVTSTDLPWERLLRLCKSRDALEYNLTIMQDDAEGKVKYMPNEDASFGALFIEFLSMQLKAELLNRVRSKEEGKMVSAHDIISVLKKMRIAFTADRWKLTVLTDEQRAALRLAGVPVPTDI